MCIYDKINTKYYFMGRVKIMKKCMLSLLILSLCGVFFIDAAVAYDPFYLQAAAQGSAAVKQLANDQNVSVVKTEGVKKAKPVNTNAGCVLLENMPTNPEDDSFIQDFINWLDDTTYSGSDEYLYLNGEASRAEKSLFICGAKAGKTWCGKTDIIYIDGNSGAFIGSAPQDKRGFYRCSTSDLDDLWTVWKSLAGLKKCDYNQIKEYHCVGDPTDNEKKVCFSVEPTVRSNLIYAVLKESQMCTTSVELYEHVLSEESDAKNVSAGDKKDSNAEFEESGAKNVSAGNKKDIKTEEMVISGGDIDIDDVVADVKEYCFDILDAGVKNPDGQEFITASCDSGDAKKTKECKQLVEKSLSSGPTSKEGVSDDKGSIKDKKGAAKKDGKTDSKKQSGTTGGTKSSGTADEGCDFYSSALVKCNGEDILLDKEKILL